MPERLDLQQGGRQTKPPKCQAPLGSRSRPRAARRRAAPRGRPCPAAAPRPLTPGPGYPGCPWREAPIAAQPPAQPLHPRARLHSFLPSEKQTRYGWRQRGAAPRRQPPRTREVAGGGGVRRSTKLWQAGEHRAWGRSAES